MFIINIKPCELGNYKRLNICLIASLLQFKRRNDNLSTSGIKSTIFGNNLPPCPNWGRGKCSQIRFANELTKLFQK